MMERETRGSATVHKRRNLLPEYAPVYKTSDERERKAHRLLPMFASESVGATVIGESSRLQSVGNRVTWDEDACPYEDDALSVECSGGETQGPENEAAEPMQLDRGFAAPEAVAPERLCGGPTERRETSNRRSQPDTTSTKVTAADSAKLEQRVLVSPAAGKKIIEMANPAQDGMSLSSWLEDGGLITEDWSPGATLEPFYANCFRRLIYVSPYNAETSESESESDDPRQSPISTGTSRGPAPSTNLDEVAQKLILLTEPRSGVLETLVEEGEQRPKAANGKTRFLQWLQRKFQRNNKIGQSPPIRPI